MDSIKINIVLPKASELKSDLNTLLTQIQGKTKLNLEFDISTFKTSIGEVSQLLGKLKTQVSTLGGFETLVNTNMVKESTKAIQEQSNAMKEQQKILDGQVTKTSSTKILGVNGEEDKLINDLIRVKDEYGNITDVITNYNRETGAVNETLVKNTNEIEKQKIANEKLVASAEKIKDAMQLKLNESLSNKNFSLIDDSVFTSLQQKINSINTETPEREIRELQNALKNLNNSDSQIVRLQNAISKYEAKIDGLKDKYKNLVPKNELNEAISKIGELKNLLSQVQSSEGVFTNKAISNTLNEAGTSMNKLGTATKTASDQQRLYNKEVITFKSAFSDIATKVGIFSVVYSAVNKVQSSFREGVQSVIDMDTALTDLNKVVDLNQKQLLGMRDSAVSMGEALGRNSIDVAKSMAEFGKQYKTMNEINEMTRVSILGANVMDGTTSAEVAKGLTTIINSLKLSAEDAINIIDSLNEVQNNYRVDSSEMLSALSKIGSTASVAGASLEQLEGYITSLSVSTGKSGDEIGESLKSITSRIYKIGSEGIESEGKPEIMLKEMGVAVRDLEGNFRPLNEILSDLSVKWKTMTDTQKIATAQVVAGQHKYNDFISLLNNFGMATEATATAMNAVGSATLENEKYLTSIQGKMESLKATTQGFFLDFINSDLIKGGVDALQSLMNILNGLQGTFGSLGLTVGTLSSAFLIFTNNPLKQLSRDIVFHKTTLGGLSDIYNQVKYAVTQTGSSMNIAQKSSLALRTGYDLLGNSALITQVKVMALQAVLGGLLSLAITTAVAGITKLISSLNTSGKSMKDVEVQASSLSQSLDDVSKERELSSQYEKIGKLLQDSNITQSESVELQKQLDTITQDLISSEDEYYWILKNGNLTLDERLEKMEQIRQKKLFDESKELDDSMMSQGDIEKKVELLQGYVSSYNDIKSAIETGVSTGNFSKLIDLIGVSDIEEANQVLKETKNKINELDGEVLEYNASLLKMSEANYETDRSNIKLKSGTEGFIKTLNDATNATNENTKAKEQNSVVGGTGEEASIKELAKAYSDTIQEMENLYSVQEKINEAQAITPKLAMELLNLYPELGSRVSSLAETQEFLNQKIGQSASSQQEAYAAMVANDNSYYTSKVANDDALQQNFNQLLSSFVTNSGESYQTDLKNYSNLSQLKAALTAQYGETIASLVTNFVSAQSGGYDVDLDK